MIYIDEPLSDYRQHGTNSVGAKNVRSFAYFRQVLENIDEMKRRIQNKKKQAASFKRMGKRSSLRTRHFCKDSSWKEVEPVSISAIED